VLVDEVVVKLGGSFVTKKGDDFSFREEDVGRAAEALRQAGAKLAIVHGGGSFGHPLAVRYGLSSSRPKKGSEGVPETRLAMHHLSYMICQQLLKAGLRPFLLHATSLVRPDGSPAPGHETLLRQLLKSGLTPVSHGDVFPFKQGFKVLSGDHLAFLFCRALKPRRMVYVLDQPGILEREGEPSSLIRELNVRELRRMVFPTGRDATGGIGAKLEAARKITSLGVEVRFVSGFNLDGLIRAVSGANFEGTLLRG